VNDIGNANTTTSTVTNTAIVSDEDADRPRRSLGGGWARLKGLGAKEDAEKGKKSRDVSPSDGSGSKRSAPAAAASSVGEQQYKEIIKNMAEFKTDMKAEIGRMNDKINRMEELNGRMEGLMTDFIGKLSAALPRAADEDRERRRGAGRKEKQRSRSRSKVSPTEDDLPQRTDNKSESADGGESGARGRPRTPSSQPQSPSRGNGRIHFVPGQREEFL